MVKENYPILKTTTYLNTAYVGLMSTQLYDFRRDQERSYLEEGGDRYKIKAYNNLDLMHQNFAH